MNSILQRQDNRFNTADSNLLVAPSAYNLHGKIVKFGSPTSCTSLPDSFSPDCWARTSFAAGRSCRCSARAPVQTAHWMPGRVRLRVPSLAENAAGAAAVREKLPTIQGVQSVKLNPASGSVLIVYRDDEVRPELLFAAVVRLMNLDAELNERPQPIVTRELREILGSVNRMVYDRTGGLIDLWSAGLILLAAIGVQRLLIQGMRAFPAGLTLLWCHLAGVLRTAPGRASSHRRASPARGSPRARQRPVPLRSDDRSRRGRS